MRFAELPVAEFNLRMTLESGQVFHWRQSGSGWEGLAGITPLYAEQRGNVLLVNEGREALARDYFSLDHPLESIYASFPADAYTQAALGSCRGLRIIRQPHWECLATFITSAMKQVAHIRAMSRELRGRFGTPVADSEILAYPEPSRLARASEEDLRACGLGFRAKSLLATARVIANGEVDLDAVARMETAEARETLCRLPGVGPKVANCVLLFAYERLDSVPIDVWIARVLHGMRRRKGTEAQLQRYSRKRFGAYAGYVQQYLFHHARVSKALPAAT